MLPPDPETLRDTTPHRTVGRRGRPLTLVVAVALFAVFWCGVTAMGVVALTHDRSAGNIAGVVFWTVAVALLLWRVWCGGRRAISFMERVGTLLGLVYLGGMVAFLVLLAALPHAGGARWHALAYFLPGLVSGAALFAAGRLLNRPEVRRWRA
jgi:hypothetical protein